LREISPRYSFFQWAAPQAQISGKQILDILEWTDRLCQKKNRLCGLWQAVMINLQWMLIAERKFFSIGEVRQSTHGLTYQTHRTQYIPVRKGFDLARVQNILPNKRLRLCSHHTCVWSTESVRPLDL
jgi:hypothetical protein